jgi:hypothetical protein
VLFISYSNRDLDSAETVCAALESVGNKCWLARRDIGPAEEWLAAILTAIETADTVVLVFSAYANQSPQVRREIAHAVKLDRRIRVMRLDATEPSGVFRLLSSEIFESAPASVVFEDRLESICSAIAANENAITERSAQPKLIELLTGAYGLTRLAVRANFWIEGVRILLAALLIASVFVEKLTREDALGYAAFALPFHFAGLMWVIVSLSVLVATTQVKQAHQAPYQIWRAFFRPLSFLTEPGKLLQASLALEGRQDLATRARVCWMAVATTSIFSLGMLVVVGSDDVRPLSVLVPDLILSIAWCACLGIIQKLVPNQ